MSKTRLMFPTISQTFLLANYRWVRRLFIMKRIDRRKQLKFYLIEEYIASQYKIILRWPILNSFYGPLKSIVVSRIVLF